MDVETILPRDVFVGQDFYVPAFRILVGNRELRAENHDILSVTYSDSLTSVDSFNVVVSNWDAEKRTFKYSDASTFDPGQTVEVWMGYHRNGQDERRRMLVGDITTLAPSFPTGGGPTLAVGGLNVLHRFRTKQVTKAFLGKKDTDIARELVKDIAAEVRKTAPQLDLQLDPDDASRNAGREAEIPYLVMSNQYPIVFLMERARRIGYELSIDETPRGERRQVTFHFRPTSDVARATYVLEWGKSLVSFQPTLQTANQVSQVTVRGWDPKAKKEIVETASRSDLAGEGIVNPDDLGFSDPVVGQRQEVIADQPIQSREEAKLFAKKALRQIAQDLVEARGRTIGLPDLRAGGKIQVGSLGRRFSGIYLVTATTHTLGDGGYTTDFTARKEKG